jgi:hypothetical protein
VSGFGKAPTRTCNAKTHSPALTLGGRLRSALDTATLAVSDSSPVVGEAWMPNLAKRGKRGGAVAVVLVVTRRLTVLTLT